MSFGEGHGGLCLSEIYFVIIFFDRILRQYYLLHVDSDFWPKMPKFMILADMN